MSSSAAEGAVAAIDPNGLDAWSADDLGKWQSGWLGARLYGHSTHGFAEIALDSFGTVTFRILWLAPDGDVHEGFRLRFDPPRRCVDLISCVSEEPACEQSIAIDDELCEQFASLSVLGETYPDELFTLVAALHHELFEVLPSDRPAASAWDHQWHQGPNATSF